MTTKQYRPRLNPRLQQLIEVQAKRVGIPPNELINRMLSFVLVHYKDVFPDRRHSRKHPEMVFSRQEVRWENGHVV